MNLVAIRCVFLNATNHSTKIEWVVVDGSLAESACKILLDRDDCVSLQVSKPFEMIDEVHVK